MANNQTEEIEMKDRIATLSENVQEVTNIMQQNVDKIFINETDLNYMENQSIRIREDAKSLNLTATKANRMFKIENKKMTIFLVFFCFLLCSMIILAIILY